MGISLNNLQVILWSSIGAIIVISTNFIISVGESYIINEILMYAACIIMGALGLGFYIWLVYFKRIAYGDWKGRTLLQKACSEEGDGRDFIAVFVSPLIYILVPMFYGFALILMFVIPTKFWAWNIYEKEAICISSIKVSRKIGDVNKFRLVDSNETVFLAGIGQTCCYREMNAGNNENYKLCTLKGRSWFFGRYIDDVSCEE